MLVGMQVGMLVCWYAGWYAGMLVCRLVCWYAGWYAAALTLERAFAAGRRRRRLSSWLYIPGASSHRSEDNWTIMMILPLVTSLIALHLIQAKNLLIETEEKNPERQVDAEKLVRYIYIKKMVRYI